MVTSGSANAGPESRNLPRLCDAEGGSQRFKGLWGLGPQGYVLRSGFVRSGVLNLETNRPGAVRKFQLARL